MKILTNNKILAPLFALIVFLFYSMAYSFHLNYQEQYQLFLFTSDYFTMFFSKPGGISDYIGNFFTQFYFYSWVGAIIIALLLTAMQQLVWHIAKKVGASKDVLLLTFIPSILYWGLLCDENNLLGGLIAFLIPLVFITGYQIITNNKLRVLIFLVSIPLLYWLSGGAFLIFVIFGIINELWKRDLDKTLLISTIAATIVLSVLCPILSKHYLLQLPIQRVFNGANYSRFTTSIPFFNIVIFALLIILPFALKYLTSKIVPAKASFIKIIQLLIVVVGGYFFVHSGVDMGKEEVMTYDFYTRMRRWDKVIALADKKTPTSPLSVTCLNLALAKQDLLGERMFHYFQNGTAGLLPDYVRDYTIPLVTNEVYYHLGFINTAQRYAFEAMEALPDYQKSSRVMMRLAETNLINGNYAVATKYLHILQNTFFYKNWATKTLETIKDEKLIAEHPEWGWLRQCRVEEDFLFSEKEKDMMLGLLFKHNRQNRMACEYLLAYTLLNKDLKHFWQYFPLSETLNYRVIPQSFQEALSYIWSIGYKKPLQAIPFPIGTDVKQRMQSFGSVFTSSPDPQEALRQSFSDTYWYYLQFRK